jgi:uncharacterized membrane protein YcaP (DUF421 family)
MNPFLDICIRASVVYIFIVLALRLFGKKELAQLSVIDLVFILLISNAVQNAMVGADTSLWGGLMAAGVLFLTNFILKYAIHRFSSINKLLQGEPVMLIYKGKIQDKNLEKVDISIQELETAMREHGISAIENVDLAMLEIDGNISFLSDDFKTKSMKSRLSKKTNDN